MRLLSLKRRLIAFDLDAIQRPDVLATDLRNHVLARLNRRLLLVAHDPGGVSIRPIPLASELEPDKDA